MTDTNPNPNTDPKPALTPTKRHRATKPEPERRPTWQIFWAIIAGAAIIAAAILVIGLDGNDDDSGSNPQAAVTVTATQATIQASADECGPDGLPLAFQPDGALPDFQLLPDKADSSQGHAVDNDSEVRKGYKENPRFLAAFAHRLSSTMWPNADDWKPLATDNLKCMSDKGKELLDKIDTLLTFELDHVDENGLVDANLTNMGLGPNGPVSNATPGISGDRSAVVYHFKDGTVVPVMKRCANLPTPGATYPTTTTFTTPPTTTKTTPSTTTSTTTTETTTTQTTTTETTTTQTTTSTTPSTTLPSKTPTHNPSQPPGETQHPSPPGTPESTPPVETNPAPPPASVPTDAPIIPVTSTRVDIPTQDPALPSSTTETVIITDPPLPPS